MAGELLSGPKGCQDKGSTGPQWPSAKQESPSPNRSGEGDTGDSGQLLGCLQVFLGLLSTQVSMNREPGCRKGGVPAGEGRCAVMSTTLWLTLAPHKSNQTAPVAVLCSALT